MSTSAKRAIGRLSFWLDPGQVGAFGRAYEAELAPLLRQRGLVEMAWQRPAAPGAFCRYFSMAAPGEIPRREKALQQDSDWQRALTALAAQWVSGDLRWRLRVCSAVAGPGQTTAAGAGIRQGLWHTIGLQDGLPSARVYALTKDRRGHLWLATARGACRYDGSEFATFGAADGLASDRVRTVLEDRQGQLWFGSGDRWGHSEAGVSRYDGTRFETFAVEDGLAGDGIRSMIEDRDGGVWLGTDGGVSYYDGEDFVSFTVADGLAEGTVSALCQDRQGRLWLGSDGGVSCWDGERVAVVATGAELGKLDICALREDQAGRLWIGGSPDEAGNNLSCYDGRAFHHYGAGDGLAAGPIYALLENRDRQLWIGTSAGAGGSCYDGVRFANFGVEDGLTNGQVTDLFEDEAGHLWWTTDGGGVSRYDGALIAAFTQEDGLLDSLVLSAAQDRQGRLWFGSYQGLTCYDGEHFATFPLGDRVWSIVEDRQDRLWFATYGGVRRLQGAGFARLTMADGLSDDNVSCILEDLQGRLWLGTWFHGGGLCRCDDVAALISGAAPLVHFTTADGLADDNITCLCEDSEERVWVGTEGGLSLYDGVGFKSFTTADGLVADAVTCCCLDRRGRLWVGTQKGVSCYDGAHFTNYTMAEGLVDELVLCIFEDDRSHLWFGSHGGGLTRFDGQIFQGLSRRDGLIDDVVQQILQDRDGMVWIATEGGVNRYCPSRQVPALRLVEVVAGQRLGTEEVQVPVSQQLVAFEFEGSSLTTQSERLAYVYRLVGRDGEWRPSYEPRVEYQGLAEGNYTFEVRAVDRDLNYSDPASVRLKVVPDPRDRRIDELEQRVRARTQELEQKNSDLEQANTQLAEANQAKSLFLANISHEIRTPMNAILGYAQVLRRDADLRPDFRAVVDIIRQSGDHLLKLINEVLDLSKIEAGRMELQTADFDLAALLQGHAAMFRLRCQEQGLAWSLKGVGSDARWVRGDENKLSQVLINLLSNAVKFTEAGSVALRLKIEDDDRYRFEVADTGPGISAEEQQQLFEEFRQGVAGHSRGGTGLGLALARRFVAMMGGELAVESTPGAGSTFSFALALPAGAAQAVAVGRWSQVVRLAPGQNARVLVADDVEENRDVLRRLLEGIGAEVAVVADGQQALDRLEKWRADVVFLDILMPVLDGRETIERIRQRAQWAELPVVAVSASTLAHQRQEMLGLGFDRFIGKPFRFEEVCLVLAELLGVEYLYAEDETGPERDDGADWRDIAVPAALVERLREAAEYRMVTQLEAALGELEGLGADQAGLAAQLRRLRQRHRMDALLALLDGLAREEG